MSKDDAVEVMPHVFGAVVILACVPKEAQQESLAMLHSLIGAENCEDALVALVTEFALTVQQDAWNDVVGWNRK